MSHYRIEHWAPTVKMAISFVDAHLLLLSLDFHIRIGSTNLVLNQIQSDASTKNRWSAGLTKTLPPEVRRLLIC